MNADAMPLIAIATPLAGALIIALIGRSPNLRETVTIITSLSLFGVVVSLLQGVLQGDRPELTLIEMLPGLALRLNVEPLGMLFACVAALLWPITSMYSFGYMRANNESSQTRFYVCFAIAMASTIGVAFAANLLTLLVFYEALTLSTYPLVTHKRDEKSMRAGRIYLGILLTTSIGLLLPAILWTYLIAGTLEFTPGGILEGHISTGLATLLLMLFVLGVGKAAIMPVHRWLPEAMVAPTPVSALLHAVAVVKAGVFTITKVIIYIFGIDFLVNVPAERLLVYLAGFTVVAASIVALRQNEIKRLLAYSTISQLSYIILAALVLTPASEIGASIHIVAHAFSKITLFFTAGAIYIAAKKTQVTQLNGIGKRMPLTMTAFAIGALSMIGVPPTAGFVSKWFIIAGAFELNDYFVLVVLVLSTGLNAAYFLPIIFRAFFLDEVSKPANDHGEAPWPMVAALVITASLTILFFVFNGPVVEFEYGILEVAQ